MEKSTDGKHHEKLEAAVREREETFRALAENSLDTIMRFDRQCRHLYVNPSVESDTGIPAKDFIGKTHRELGFPDALIEQWELAILSVFDTAEVNRIEFCLPGGTWIDWLLMPEFGPDGDVKAVITSGRDITERKRSEQALRDSEEALRRSEAAMRALLDAPQETMMLLELDGTVVAVNEVAARRLGHSPEEIVGTCILDLFSPEVATSRREHAARAVTTGQPVHFEDERDGQSFEVNVYPVAGNSDEAKRVAVFAQDVTEQRKAEARRAALERQLFQAQKMESIGRLAGGVAHDFNNVLTAINGYADIVSSSLDPGDPLGSDVAEIKTAGERAMALIAQLLAFSRQQVIAPKVIRPNETIERSEKMLQRMIGEDVQLTFEPDPELWRIKVDPGQLDQVLMNLVVNARDAMRKGGSLKIETRNVTLENALMGAAAQPVSGEYVMLTVTDTGCGMDEETRARIFEPFFSTKSKEQGTGLGLATVYGIVAQNSGFVRVQSELDVGTAFRLYFPRVTEEADLLPVERDGGLPGGDETILLVEDESLVRGLAQRILTKRGYHVIEAADGGQAYLLSKAYEGPIHLLLTDVVMPVMTGRDLCNELQGKRPDLKVLYMSGYTDEVIAQHGVLDEGVSFLQKPFTIAALAQKVREVLDG